MDLPFWRSGIHWESGSGVIFFFNHFGRWKITQDPTPIEVEMRTYEDEVDNTILEMENRKEN